MDDVFMLFLCLFEGERFLVVLLHLHYNSFQIPVMMNPKDRFF